MLTLSRRDLLAGAMAAAVTSRAATGMAAPMPATTPHPIAPLPPRRQLGAPRLPANSTIVFLVPHADDETITMGLGIRAAVRSGRTVRVVLVTDGCGSYARKAVEARLGAESGGEPVVLTDAQFAAARRAEQIAALARLGVPASAVSAESVPGVACPPGFPYVRDGLESAAVFADVVAAYLSRYPKAAFATTSWLDWHPDHFHLGYALDAAVRADPTRRAVFFQSPLYQPAADGGPRVHVVARPGVTTAIPPIATPYGGFLTDPASTSQFSAAVDEFGVWAPGLGRYAIGATSVPEQLEYVRSVSRSWMHLDSSRWRSRQAMTDAHDWATAYQTLPGGPGGAAILSRSG